MRRLCALLLVISVGCAGGAAPADSDGFVPLFNGHDLTGWVPVNCAPETFRAADGLIVISGKPTGVMRTERMYENYIVELDWMHLKKGGNSGFFIHSGALPVKGQPFTKGHEIQVLDGDDPKGQWTGHGDVFSIHGASFVPDRPHPAGWMRCLPSEKRAHPYGEWNHYRITVNDGSVKLEVNGKEVSGGTKCNPRKGYICLESEGAPCHMRNIRIKELPSTNPPPEEIADEYQGYRSIYSGLDFRGWTAGEGWIAKDWILSHEGKDKGAIDSTDTHTDYAFSFDWRSKGGGKVAVRVNGRAFPVRTPENPGEWTRVQCYIAKSAIEVDQTCSKMSSVLKPSTIGLEAEGSVQFANLFLKEPN